MALKEHLDQYREVKDHELAFNYTFEYALLKLYTFGIVDEADTINPNRLMDLYNAVFYLENDEAVQYTDHGLQKPSILIDILAKLDYVALSSNTIWGKVCEIISMLIAAAKEEDVDPDGVGTAVPFLSWGDDKPSSEEQREISSDTVEELQKLFEKLDPKDSADQEFLKTAGLDLTNSFTKYLSFDENVFKIMRIVAALDNMTFMEGSETVSERTEDEDPSGDDISRRPLEDVSEMSGMDLEDLLDEDLDYKILNEDAELNYQFDPGEDITPGVLILAVDDSGSMNMTYKLEYVRVILMRLLSRVKAGDLIIYLATFEDNVDPFTRIADEVDVEYAMANFFGFNRGVTSIGIVMEQIASQIKSGVLKGEFTDYPLEKAKEYEIVILNDGQDAIDRNYTPPLKTSAVCLLETNDDLEKVCIRSGGQYLAVEAN